MLNTKYKPKQMNRRADRFPMAENHSNEKELVTNWCSNDYLGMSRHPKVISAARFVIELIFSAKITEKVSI